MTENDRQNLEVRSMSGHEAAHPLVRRVTVVAAHTTTHLPPERAVITTPALVALIEQVVVEMEQTGSAHEIWVSMAADFRHRGGLKQGEVAEITVESAEATPDRRVWRASIRGPEGRHVGEGTLVRERTASWP